MSKILLLNKNLLKEAPVSGDKSAAAIASAKSAGSDIESRLQGMGIYPPELDNFYKVEQLAIEPFVIDFLLQVPDLQDELTIPNPKAKNYIAEVVDKNGQKGKAPWDPLIFKMLDPKSNNFFLMEFLKVSEEKTPLPADTGIDTRIPGTKAVSRGIHTTGDGQKKGKFYDVRITKNIKDIILKKKKEKEGDGSEEDEEKNKPKGLDIKVGEEYFYHNKKGQKNVVKVVSLTNTVLAGKDKQFLTKDDKKKIKLSNPDIVFVVFKKSNNTYGASPALAVDKNRLTTDGKFNENKPKNTVESFINSISKSILLKEEDDEGTKNQGEKKELDFYEGKIIISRIKLKVKDKAKRLGNGGSETSSTESKKWSGKVNDLDKKLTGLGKGIDVGVEIKINTNGLSGDELNAVKEIENFVNLTSTSREVNKAKLRKSKDVNNNKIFIVEFNIKGQKGALICSLDDESSNLKEWTDVEIGKKAAGDDRLEGKKIKAEIKIS